MAERAKRAIRPSTAGTHDAPSIPEVPDAPHVLGAPGALGDKVPADGGTGGFRGRSHGDASVLKQPSLTEEESAAAEALARACLEECRRELMMSFRFLSVALWRMPFEAEAGVPSLATDGRKLYFDPVECVRAFRRSPELLARSYLHAILHCVFRHPLEQRHEDPGVWSLAADLVVESIALEMCKERYVCEGDERRRRVIEDLTERFGGFAPRLVARWLARSYAKAKDGQDHERLDAHGPLLSAGELMACERLFEFDSHRRWASHDLSFEQRGDAPRRASEEGPDSDSEQIGDSGDDERAGELKTGSEDAEKENEAFGQAEKSKDEPTGDSGETGQGVSPDADGLSDQKSAPDTSGDDGSGTGASEELQLTDDAEAQAPTAEEAGNADDELREWDEIAHELEMELRSHAKLWSDGTGRLSAVLQIENRKRYDYADFLRRFSTLQEDMRVNDEEFDYIYYTYGLERYGNMPLVEPLEHKEERRIREFAIVIDTSGSCSGELVTRFIGRTYDILRGI